MPEGKVEVARCTPPRVDGAGSERGAPDVYRRHQPETTALYEVVRDNLETLFGAIDDGALAVRIPRHARKEPIAYIDCGLLCGPRLRARGFARLRCRACAVLPILHGTADEWREASPGVREVLGARAREEGA